MKLKYKQNMVCIAKNKSANLQFVKYIDLTRNEHLIDYEEMERMDEVNGSYGKDSVHKLSHDR